MNTGSKDNLSEYFTYLGLNPDPSTWAAVEKLPDELDNAVTGVCIIHPKHEAVPKGYSPLEYSVSGLSANLNSGGWLSTDITLCVERDYNKRPITQLAVVSEKGRAATTLTVITTTPSGRHADLNHRSGGKTAYLAFGHDPCYPPVLDVAVVDKEAETVPSAYKLIDANLNKWSMGKSIYICFRPASNTTTPNTAVAVRADLIDRMPRVDRSNCPLPPGLSLIAMPRGARIVRMDPTQPTPAPEFRSTIFTDAAGDAMACHSLHFFETLPDTPAVTDAVRRLAPYIYNSTPQPPLTSPPSKSQAKALAMSALPVSLLGERAICFLSRVTDADFFRAYLAQLLHHSLQYKAAFGRALSRRKKAIKEKRDAKLKGNTSRFSPLNATRGSTPPSKTPPADTSSMSPSLARAMNRLNKAAEELERGELPVSEAALDDELLYSVEYFVGLLLFSGAVSDIDEPQLLQVLPVVRPISISMDPHTQFALPPGASTTSYYLLARLLSAEHVLTALSLLLLEQKLVIVSAHDGLAAEVAEALRTLLFPFEWQFTYIPSCPVLLLDCIEAPMPFLFGIHADDMPLYIPPGVYVLDVDADTLVVGSLPQHNPDLRRTIAPADVAGEYARTGRRGPPSYPDAVPTINLSMLDGVVTVADVPATQRPKTKRASTTKLEECFVGISQELTKPFLIEWNQMLQEFDVAQDTFPAENILSCYNNPVFTHASAAAWKQHSTPASDPFTGLKVGAGHNTPPAPGSPMRGDTNDSASSSSTATRRKGQVAAAGQQGVSPQRRITKAGSTRSLVSTDSNEANMRIGMQVQSMLNWSNAQRYRMFGLRRAVRDICMRMMASLLAGYRQLLLHREPPEMARKTRDDQAKADAAAQAAGEALPSRRTARNVRYHEFGQFDKVAFVTTQAVPSNRWFAAHFVCTQVFQRFIEQRTFPSNSDRALFFFDCCLEHAARSSMLFGPAQHYAQLVPSSFNSVRGSTSGTAHQRASSRAKSGSNGSSSSAASTAHTPSTSGANGVRSVSRGAARITPQESQQLKRSGSAVSNNAQIRLRRGESAAAASQQLQQSSPGASHRKGGQPRSALLSAIIEKEYAWLDNNADTARLPTQAADCSGGTGRDGFTVRTGRVRELSVSDAASYRTQSVDASAGRLPVRSLSIADSSAADAHVGYSLVTLESLPDPRAAGVLVAMEESAFSLEAASDEEREADADDSTAADDPDAVGGGVGSSESAEEDEDEEDLEIDPSEHFDPDHPRGRSAKATSSPAGSPHDSASPFQQPDDVSPISRRRRRRGRKVRSLLRTWDTMWPTQLQADLCLSFIGDAADRDAVSRQVYIPGVSDASPATAAAVDRWSVPLSAECAAAVRSRAEIHDSYLHPPEQKPYFFMEEVFATWLLLSPVYVVSAATKRHALLQIFATIRYMYGGGYVADEAAFRALFMAAAETERCGYHEVIALWSDMTAAGIATPNALTYGQFRYALSTSVELLPEEDMTLRQVKDGVPVGGAGDTDAELQYTLHPGSDEDAEEHVDSSSSSSSDGDTDDEIVTDTDDETSVQRGGAGGSSEAVHDAPAFHHQRQRSQSLQGPSTLPAGQPLLHRSPSDVSSAASAHAQKPSPSPGSPSDETRRRSSVQVRQRSLLDDARPEATGPSPAHSHDDKRRASPGSGTEAAEATGEHDEGGDVTQFRSPAFCGKAVAGTAVARRSSVAPSTSHTAGRRSSLDRWNGLRGVVTAVGLLQTPGSEPAPTPSPPSTGGATRSMSLLSAAPGVPTPLSHVPEPDPLLSSAHTPTAIRVAAQQKTSSSPTPSTGVTSYIDHSLNLLRKREINRISVLGVCLRQDIALEAFQTGSAPTPDRHAAPKGSLAGLMDCWPDEIILDHLGAHAMDARIQHPFRHGMCTAVLVVHSYAIPTLKQSTSAGSSSDVPARLGAEGMAGPAELEALESESGIQSIEVPLLPPKKFRREMELLLVRGLPSMAKLEAMRAGTSGDTDGLSDRGSMSTYSYMPGRNVEDVREFITSDHLEQRCPTLYWNAMYYFSRFNLPWPFLQMKRRVAIHPEVPSITARTGIHRNVLSAPYVLQGVGTMAPVAGAAAPPHKPASTWALLLSASPSRTFDAMLQRVNSMVALTRRNLLGPAGPTDLSHHELGPAVDALQSIFMQGVRGFNLELMAQLFIRTRTVSTPASERNPPPPTPKSRAGGLFRRTLGLNKQDAEADDVEERCAEVAAALQPLVAKMPAETTSGLSISANTVRSAGRIMRACGNSVYRACVFLSVNTGAFGLEVSGGRVRHVSWGLAGVVHGTVGRSGSRRGSTSSSEAVPSPLVPTSPSSDAQTPSLSVDVQQPIPHTGLRYGPALLRRMAALCMADQAAAKLLRAQSAPAGAFPEGYNDTSAAVEIGTPFDVPATVPEGAQVGSSSTAVTPELGPVPAAAAVLPDTSLAVSAPLTPAACPVDVNTIFAHGHVSHRHQPPPASRRTEPGGGGTGSGTLEELVAAALVSAMSPMSGNAGDTGNLALPEPQDWPPQPSATEMRDVLGSVLLV